MKKLSESDIRIELNRVPGWVLRESKLFRDYTFKDFKQAFGFLTQLALISEELNHHAELYNVYNRVEISLSTHDAEGITQKDFAWAEAAEKSLQSCPK